MKPGVIITIVALGFVLVRPAFYSVTEADQVVITRFGKPVGKAITKPGLSIKSTDSISDSWLGMVTPIRW